MVTNQLSTTCIRYTLYANNILNPECWLLTSFFLRRYEFSFVLFVFRFQSYYPSSISLSINRNTFVLRWSFSFSLLNTRYDIHDTLFLPLYFFIKYITIKKVLYPIFFYAIIKNKLKQNKGTTWGDSDFLCEFISNCKIFKSNKSNDRNTLVSWLKELAYRLKTKGLFYKCSHVI